MGVRLSFCAKLSYLKAAVWTIIVFILCVFKLFYSDFEVFFSLHIDIKYLAWGGDPTTVKREMGVILQMELEEFLGIVFHSYVTHKTDFTKQVNELMITCNPLVDYFIYL
jgi:hypothetical protein